MVFGIFDCFSVRIDFETVVEDVVKLMLIDLPPRIVGRGSEDPTWAPPQPVRHHLKEVKLSSSSPRAGPNRPSRYSSSIFTSSTPWGRGVMRPSCIDSPLAAADQIRRSLVIVWIRCFLNVDACVDDGQFPSSQLVSLARQPAQLLHINLTSPGRGSFILQKQDCH